MCVMALHVVGRWQCRAVSPVSKPKQGQPQEESGRGGGPGAELGAWGASAGGAEGDLHGVWGGPEVGLPVKVTLTDTPRSRGHGVLDRHRNVTGGVAHMAEPTRSRPEAGAGPTGGRLAPPAASLPGT